MKQPKKPETQARDRERAKNAVRILKSMKIKTGVKAGICRTCGLVASGLA